MSERRYENRFVLRAVFPYRVVGIGLLLCVFAVGFSQVPTQTRVITIEHQAFWDWMDRYQFLGETMCQALIFNGICLAMILAMNIWRTLRP